MIEERFFWKQIPQYSWIQIILPFLCLKVQTLTREQDQVSLFGSTLLMKTDSFQTNSTRSWTTYGTVFTLVILDFKDSPQSLILLMITTYFTLAPRQKNNSLDQMEQKQAKAQYSEFLILTLEHTTFTIWTVKELSQQSSHHQTMQTIYLNSREPSVEKIDMT